PLPHASPALRVTRNRLQSFTGASSATGTVTPHKAATERGGSRWRAGRDGGAGRRGATRLPTQEPRPLCRRSCTPTPMPSPDQSPDWYKRGNSGMPASSEINVDRARVADIDGRADFLGAVILPTRFSFEGTQVGGLSGIVYDAANERFLAISDDRSQIDPARFYELDIDLTDGVLQGVRFVDVTTLRQADGTEFPALSLDPEAIALTGEGKLVISSEGDASRLINPFVNVFAQDGLQIGSLPIPAAFLPVAGNTSGIRNNLAFESLTTTPDGKFLFTAVENALVQDGPAASLADESPVRIVKYDLQTGQIVGEFIYATDPVVASPTPAGQFATNGLVELLAIERSFSTGVGNAIRLYEVHTQGATDVSGFDAVGGFDIDAIADKRLLLDFADLGITLDNIEGMTLGPVLEDGRQSLILVSDNNFSGTQVTQVIAIGIDVEAIPSVAPVIETPAADRIDIDDLDARGRDLDDPAIYLNATDPAKSFVITTEKDAGFTSYDLNGTEIESSPDAAIRYNNVDLIYGFELDGTAVDLAVFSDRENDTLAVYRIDAATQTLVDVTSAELLDSAFTIFGEDDGEATAYGLATYKSIKDGKSYAYVTQADGAQVAQLELIDNGDGTVTAEVVRTILLPVPAGDDAEDYQSEGIVVDQETGRLYVVPEGEIGILRYSAEADGGQDYAVVQPIDQAFFTPDVEGLSIYYGEDGEGYLIASSQGDNTFAVFSRTGNNAYLGSFVVGSEGGIDGVQETDGIDIFSGPL
ncbi:MAG TPA: phytase, partial [Ilumatobacteraceae bacterium]|nr:phytase [Ilumatobacteraceae bacterium]